MKARMNPAVRELVLLSTIHSPPSTYGVCMFVFEMGRLLLILFCHFDDLAVVHSGDAVGVGKNPVIVGDDDHGAVGRAGDLAEQV